MHRLLPDIAGKGDRRAIGVRDFGDKRIELSLPAGGDDDLGAFPGKEFGGGAADAGAGAGDDGDLVGECKLFLHPWYLRWLHRQLGCLVADRGKTSHPIPAKMLESTEAPDTSFSSRRKTASAVANSARVEAWFR